jgi:hypothetical protein
MSEVELVDDIDSDALYAFTNWALETGIWDGRVITYQEGSRSYQKILNAIANYLSAEDASIVQFQKMIATLAYLGAEDKSLLEKEIQDLNLSNNLIIKTSSNGSIKKFWKKHKKKILIGIAVVAVVTVAVVITVCSVSAATTAVAGVALAQDKEKKNPPKDIEIRPSYSSNPPPIEINLDDKIVFNEDNIQVGNQYFTYTEMLQQAKRDEFIGSFKPNSTNLFSHLKKPENLWVENSFEAPSSFFKRSNRYHTEGVRNSQYRIGGINGISTSIDDAKDHAKYLQQFTKDQSIDWVYNQTHGVVSDIAEVLTFNYLGSSPNTEKLLRKNWEEFHQDSLGNSKAKLLQVCHSQGAIHVRNALENSPPEIQDRIMVVATAPAAIISKKICYRSFNYASKKDPIPKAEFNLMFSASLEIEDVNERLQVQKMLRDKQDELILLDPHPDAKGIDHDFQSPTFKFRLKDHIIEYYNQKGEYK